MISPGLPSPPRDINPAGEIVGRYGGAHNRTHGYLRSKEGEFTSIDFPGASATFAMGINPRGDIVGQYTSAGVTHGYVLSGSSFTTIDFPAASETRAWKITRRGQILGGYVGADGKNHIFVLSEGEFTAIDLPGALVPTLETGGINNRGDIAGWYCDTAPCTPASTDIHGFLLSEGEFTTIDLPGLTCTSPLAINSRGDIVGAYSTDSACTDVHGFLLSRKEGEGDEDGRRR